MGAAGEAGLAEAERAEPVVAAVEEGEEPEAAMATAGPAAEVVPWVEVVMAAAAAMTVAPCDQEATEEAEGAAMVVAATESEVEATVWEEAVMGLGRQVEEMREVAVTRAVARLEEVAVVARGRRETDHSRRSDSAARHRQRCSRGWRRRPARISYRGSTGSERCRRRRRGWRCMAAERRAAAAPVEEAWWVEVALAAGQRAAAAMAVREARAG